MGKPDMTAFAIGPCDKDLDIYAVADAMEKKGYIFIWSLHIMILN